MGAERVSAIVLAAGLSRRYGETNKLLQDIDGHPMIRAVVQTTIDAGCRETIVVIGHESEQIRAALDGLGCRLIHNRDYESGIGASIAAGVKAAIMGETGFLIIPGDMPHLTAATLIALVDGAAPHRLSACRGTDGSPISPAFFGADYRRELESLREGTGAKKILMEHADKLRQITVDESELQDFDEPQMEKPLTSQ